MTDTTPSIALLLTGNELMSGDIVDSNSAMIATEMLAQGFSVDYKVTVADDLLLLEQELNRLSERYDVLLVNGGLGPTVDDLTAEALANAAGLPLCEHAAALTHLKAFCAAKNFKMSAANLKQTLLPKGCSDIPNSVGTAVGFSLTLNDCLVLCTPGVPSELRLMLAQEILPMLDKAYPHRAKPLRHRMRVFGYGESGLQQLLEDSFPDWPAAIDVGFRASMPMLELKLQAYDVSASAQLDHCASQVRALLGDHIVCENDGTMAESLVALMQDKGQTFTCAESCTGGKIASLVTEVAGCSSVFEAGFVTYSNAIKTQVLGVPHKILEEHGAVSEPVVRAMLAGALSKSGANIGVAVSGIAGPGGGSADKPVGTVWLAWGSNETMHAAAFFIPIERQRFQQWVSAMAMDLCRRFVLESDQEPNYFRERRVRG